jgi:formylglycine-generating enzyme required for sulfatase activity
MSGLTALKPHDVAAAGPQPETLKMPIDAALAKKMRAEWAKYLDCKVDEKNSIGILLTFIPPGEFMMGSPKSEEGRFAYDDVQHRVQITRPFYIGTFLVTQAQYRRLTGINPSGFSRSGDKQSEVAGIDTSEFPVEEVTWCAAHKFCELLSEKEKAVYRLPTEAEWEYSCRAGTTTAFYFGSSCNGKEANCNGTEPCGNSREGPFIGRTSKVGSYPPNAFGLYDMAGNVYEWCGDWYAQNYYEKSPLHDPKGPDAPVIPIPGDENITRPFKVPVECGGDIPAWAARVRRGGCWVCQAMMCRSAARQFADPARRGDAVGFRIVREIPRP